MRTTDTEPGTLSERLAALKRQGCAVLVVSDAPGRLDVCRRLLGAPRFTRRQAFLATTGDSDSALDSHDGDRDAGRLGVVDVACDRRTDTRAATPSPDPSPDAAWYTAVDSLDDVASITAGVHDHLRRLSRAATDDGEVRFCLDSLDPFYDALDRRTRRHLLGSVVASVHDAGAIGHVHVSPAVSGVDRVTLQPFFDATIRVQSTPNGSVRRWLLHDSGYETDWLPE